MKIKYNTYVLQWNWNSDENKLGDTTKKNKKKKNIW